MRTRAQTSSQTPVQASRRGLRQALVQPSADSAKLWPKQARAQATSGPELGLGPRPRLASILGWSPRTSWDANGNTWRLRAVLATILGWSREQSAAPRTSWDANSNTPRLRAVLATILGWSREQSATPRTKLGRKQQHPVIACCSGHHSGLVQRAICDTKN